MAAPAPEFGHRSDILQAEFDGASGPSVPECLIPVSNYTKRAYRFPPIGSFVGDLVIQF